MRRFATCSFTIIFFSVSAICFGQKNATGYVITHQNDTLACMFKSRNWKKQPFTLKVSIAGRDSTFTPEKINGFFVPAAGIEYESKLVSPALYEINMGFLTIQDDPFRDSARFVFARRLYKGALSLYLYEDLIERKHFFIGTANGLTEVFKHFYVAAGGRSNFEPVVTTYKQYAIELKSLMQDCSSLNSIIDAIDLTKENLVKVLTLYDECMKSKDGK